MNLKHMYDIEAVDHAIKKGIKQLLSRAVNDHWRGFPTMAGTSDIWVTGFILAHINSLCDNADALNKSQKFLLKAQHPTGGWSYSAIVPPDADSTTWCIKALQSSIEIPNVALDKAKVFLWSHFKDYGVSTYNIESGIRQFISAPSDDFIAGWIAIHPDVSAAAVLADIEYKAVPEILQWLIKRQTSDGFFNSYWYRGPYYTTTLLLRALSEQQQHLPVEKARKIVEGLIHQQFPDGGFGIDKSEMPDAFSTALALESFAHLSYLGYDEERAACGKALLNSQRQDGSWPGEFILRIPAPDVTDPDVGISWNSPSGGGNSFVADQEGLFATAMACHALDCWRKTELKKNEVKS